MKRCMAIAIAGLLLAMAVVARPAAPADAAAGEYSRHFKALTDLSVAVAEAMPVEKHDFKPHPESMTYGELMTHIATTNYAFCAGLQDTKMPELPSPHEKTGVVKLLSD